MRVIISGGGTGGHIYPALAIAEGLRQRVDANILYVGTAQGLESQVVPQRGWRFQTLKAGALDRSSPIKALKSVIGVPSSLRSARQLIERFRPDLILGTGGYVSFPVLMAGACSGIKTAIHEQNAVPGIANRILAPRVDLVMLTFPEAADRMRCRQVEHTGLPVRPEILQAEATTARQRWGINAEDFVLLVFGGSLGAISINRVMLGLLEFAKNDKMNILWVCGKNNYESLSQQVRVHLEKSGPLRLQLHPYIDRMEDALAVADLAICRAGASTVSELQALGVPAILVPYPYAAENHQFENAVALVRRQAAILIKDENLQAASLYSQVKDLRSNPQQLKELGDNIKKIGHPEALETIVELLIGL